MDASTEAVGNQKRAESNPLPRMEDSEVGMPAHGSPAVDSDATYTEKDRVEQLETHASSLHKENAKLSLEVANANKKLADAHDRIAHATNDHAKMVTSHAKRVEERSQLIKKNADLLLEIADLRAMTAAQVEDIVARDNTIKELEAEKNMLMNARQKDAIEKERIIQERDAMKVKIAALLLNLKKADDDKERPRERGRSKGRYEREAEDTRRRSRSREGHREHGQKRGLSNCRSDEDTYRERGEQRARSRARHQGLVLDRRRESDRDQFSSRYYSSEQNRRDADGVLRTPWRDSYHPLSAPLPREDRRARSPPPRKDGTSRDWNDFSSANGKQPPTGPKNMPEPKPKFKKSKVKANAKAKVKAMAKFKVNSVDKDLARGLHGLDLMEKVK